MTTSKEDPSPHPRLVTFLGTGQYSATTYFLGDRIAESRFVAQALARLLDCERVIVLATSEAEKANGEALGEALEQDGRVVCMRRIPSGRSEAELREQFRIMRDTLSEDAQTPLVIDITHGFRAQPFFAGAGLAVLSAAGRLPRDMRIVYGAFEAKADNMAPIWDLSPFVEMMHFAQAAATFKRTGDARPLAEALEAERRRIAQRARRGEREYARSRLVNPLRRFAADLAATRMAALLVGVERNGKFEEPSAQALHKALRAWAEECDRDHPALVPLINDLLEMTQDLIVPEPAAREQGLAAPQARRASSALAQLYRRFGRLMEAAAVAREEIVSRVAATPEAIRAGRADFDREARERAERAAAEASGIRGLWSWRNDLLHAGMRGNPEPGEKLAANVKTLVDKIAEPPRTIIVTRHPGAVDWLRAQGILGDEIVRHMTDEHIAALRPGDRVVGTLPVELVARLCDLGVICDILSVNLGNERRGHELSADELQAAGARLVRMHARKLG
ncbi:CRISPR-associated protein Csx16 [Oceanicella actignis]|uniref:CRISPR-associated protein Csx16 n=1 Tax=Oceanicella actignis TaxID=1189325 RepID=A0A1M7S1U0_9RHOB|nr:CRISPR-associated protein Csx16 [Oceanicella actignis]SES91608.1 CRISPR-associated protein Csx16 [Oceanicella actignis]SHN52390.1 CRISPR-associated protein Csx16 [Oceanicella actignis]